LKEPRWIVGMGSRMLVLVALLALLTAPEGWGQEGPPQSPTGAEPTAEPATVERILDTRVVAVRLPQEGAAVVERQGTASEPGTWRLEGLPEGATRSSLEVLPGAPGVALGVLTLFREVQRETVPVETLAEVLRANLGRSLRLTEGDGNGDGQSVREGTVTAVLPGGAGSPLVVLAGEGETGAVVVPVSALRSVEAVTGALHLATWVERERSAARLVVEAPGTVRLLYRGEGASWSPRYLLEVLEEASPPTSPTVPEPLPLALPGATDLAVETAPPPPSSPPVPPVPVPRFGTLRLTLEAEVTNDLEDWRTVRLHLLPGDRTLPAVTLTRGSTARLPLVRAELPYQPRLLWRAGAALDRAGHWRFAEGQGGPGAEPVVAVVELRNGGRHPWPGGAITWVDGEGTVERGRMPETPGRGVARVVLGERADVFGTQREEEIDRESGGFRGPDGEKWDRLTLTGVLTVTNRGREAVEVVVDKTLVGEFLEAEPFVEPLESVTAEERGTTAGAIDPNPGHRLQWTVVVPAEGTAEIHYRYRLYARP